MIIELTAAKWHGDASVIGAYINTLRTPEPSPARTKISKEHNYKFTHRRAVAVTGGVWRVKDVKL